MSSDYMEKVNFKSKAMYVAGFHFELSKRLFLFINLDPKKRLTNFLMISCANR